MTYAASDRPHPPEKEPVPDHEATSAEKLAPTEEPPAEEPPAEEPPAGPVLTDTPVPAEEPPDAGFPLAGKPPGAEAVPAEEPPDGEVVPTGQGRAADQPSDEPSLTHWTAADRYLPVPDVPVLPEQAGVETVRQGRIGDCGLIAGMDALSGSDPHHWADHVTDHGDRATVIFYRDGKPVPVDVEKSVPVGPEGHPAGATTSDGSSFGPLVEKAYAKEFTANQYEKLDAGVWPHKTLEAMTGRPGHEASTAVGTNHIRELLADGHPVCAGSLAKDRLSEEARAERGYGPGELPIPDGAHAYTITSVDLEGNVALHNPWGHSHVQVSKEQFARQFFYVGWC